MKYDFKKIPKKIQKNPQKHGRFISLYMDFIHMRSIRRLFWGCNINGGTKKKIKNKLHTCAWYIKKSLTCNTTNKSSIAPDVNGLQDCEHHARLASFQSSCHDAEPLGRKVRCWEGGGRIYVSCWIWGLVWGR